MVSMAFDTLKYTKKLEEAGFTRSQAEAQVYVQREAMAEMLEVETKTHVTNETLQRELSPIKTDIASLKTDVAVLKWMMGFIVAGVTALVLKAFFM